MLITSSWVSTIISVFQATISIFNLIHIVNADSFTFTVEVFSPCNNPNFPIFDQILVGLSQRDQLLKTMILSKEDALVFFFSILILSIIKAQASPWCNRTCGSNNLPYPFGFSPGCKIQLNCTRNGDILVNNEFPVQNITHDKIRIHVEPKCNRSIQSFRELFTSNFAPTSTNAILLHKCSSSRACNITTLNVTTHFESFNCSKESHLSCLFNRTTGRVAGFFDRSSHGLGNCQSLLSSISFNGVTSLEIQVMDLGWWLQGNKCHCSNHANCSGVVITPAGPGYRCQCENGFHGDGYADGAGCRKGQFYLAIAAFDSAKIIKRLCKYFI